MRTSLTRSAEWDRNRGEPQQVAFVCLLVAAAALGLAVVLVPPLYVIGGLISLLAAALTLRQPYWGLLVILAFEYIRPQQLIPALQPLHLPRFLTLWVCLAWVLPMIARSRAHLIRDRQNAVMVAILAVASLSVLGAYAPGIAVGATIDLAKKIVAFFLIVNLAARHQKARGLVWAILLLNSWLAINQVVSHDSTGLGADFVRLGAGTDSFLGNTIDYAVALAVVIPFAMFLVFAERRPVLKLTAAILAVVFTAAMVGTGSRAGALGLLVLAVVFWIKSSRKGLGLALAVALIAGWWFLSPRQYQARVVGASQYHEDASAMARIEAWRVAGQMFLDRPLLGVGIGNFARVRGRLYSRTSYYTALVAHNIVLQAAAELGLAGLVVYGLLGLFILGDSRRIRELADRMDADRGRWYRNVAHALDASFIGYLVTSMFATTLYYPHLYIIAGLAVALKHSALALAGDGSQT